MMGVNYMTSAGVVHSPLPCRASPPQGGRSDAALARLTIPHLFPEQGVLRLSISPLDAEMPGRAEGVISCSERAPSCSKAATPC
jgi:hypothetical protein